MNNEEKKYNLVKFEDGDFSLEVNVSPNEETVWLTQEQMALLFNVDRTRIVRHINNIYGDNELDILSTCAENAQVQFEGARQVKRKIKIYNLDMIIAVGYRVNSKRGTQFRKWANSVLKQYLLNGYAINTERIMAYQSNILQLEANIINIENRLKNLEVTIYSDNTQIIFEGEILEPYTFLRKLFFLARNEITIIDQYADKFLLTMLSDLKVKITIVTSTSSYLNKEIIPNNISILHNDIIHDRFIVIDDLVYAIGSSFNDIGKKRFFMMKLENITKEMILQEKK
ncbi:MAG: virulence RhuM family protein [Acholeplasmatales bacterium]|nr:virulence RhuM family protein [Acholeplasmatales bacterium]